LPTRAPEIAMPSMTGSQAGGDNGARRIAARSVVVASCEDDDLCFRHDVDEAVLVIDPS
jgi:hypothetical protein